MTSPHAHTLQVPVCFSLCKSLPPWVDCVAQPSWCSRHTEKEKERLLQWHVLFLGLLLLHPRQRLVAQGAAAASRTSCHRRHTPARRTHPPTTWWTALGGSVKAHLEAGLQQELGCWCVTALWLKQCTILLLILPVTVLLQTMNYLTS